MRQKQSSPSLGHLVRIVLTVSLAGGVLAALWLSVQANSAAGQVLPAGGADAAPAGAASTLQDTGPMTLYLSYVSRYYPPPPPIFGAEMTAIQDSKGLTRAVEGGVYWVRFNAFRWDQIEPVRTSPPTYNWNVVDESSLFNATTNNLEVIATIRMTPDWAQKVAGSTCGPVKQDALDEYAEFLTALVNRYGSAPYNVRYWELGNEPDVDPSLVASDSVFGCWGDENDEYYGGRYYAEMLKVAYPAIKAADPGATVLIGGLLLDRPPEVAFLGFETPHLRGISWPSPQAGAATGHPGRFLEGILVGGGGPYFDVVNFHGYPPYIGSLQQDEHISSWESRGGVVLGKVNFLREVMVAQGVDKPIMHTEGSLICPEWNTIHCVTPGTDFYEAQADYVVWLFVRNWAEGLLGTMWYQFDGPGWRFSGMLDGSQNPKPAYLVFDFLTQELANATYTGKVTQYAGLSGYAFSKPGKLIWVLWAPDEQTYTITLPSSTTVVYDKYGADITPVGSTLSVKSPVYVESTP